MSIKIGALYTGYSYMKDWEEFISRCNGFEIVWHTSYISMLGLHISRQVPNILLLMAKQKELNVLQVITEVCRNWPSIKIMVIGDHTNLYTVRQIIETGGHGFTYETANFSTVLDGCRKLSEGEMFFDPVTQKLLLKEIIYRE